MGDERGKEDGNGNEKERVEKWRIMEYGTGGCMVYCFLPLSSSVDTGVFLKHVCQSYQENPQPAF